MCFPVVSFGSCSLCPARVPKATPCHARGRVENVLLLPYALCFFLSVFPTQIFLRSISFRLISCLWSSPNQESSIKDLVPYSFGTTKPYKIPQGQAWIPSTTQEDRPLLWMHPDASVSWCWTSWLCDPSRPPTLLPSSAPQWDVPGAAQAGWECHRRKRH